MDAKQPANGNASESLQAEVRTTLTTKRTSVAPQESAEVIEIPVLKEIPPRRTDYDASALVEQAAQQQQ